MYYTRLKVVCDSEISEILMAEVGELGFDSFLETDNGFEAYVEQENFDKPHLIVIKEKYQQAGAIFYRGPAFKSKTGTKSGKKATSPLS